MDEITINIEIADRRYPLKIARADEEQLRKASALINERMRSFSRHYSFKDMQDQLALIALQFATTSLKYESELAFSDQHLKRKLVELNTLLDELSNP